VEGTEVSQVRVLIACEFSGVVRNAFRRRGHLAYSCDLLPAKDQSPYHLQGDVRQVLQEPPFHVWDLIIAHPPCTYLCNSGVRWLYIQGTRKINRARWEQMELGCSLFDDLLRTSNAPKVAIENPIMHKHARELINCGPPDQIIQPWMFGHGETKATCLWLRNLSPLTPTKIVAGREGRIHKLPPSVDRGKLRSITYRGIADAMAKQWGG
jgi:hypothetical protein